MARSGDGVELAYETHGRAGDDAPTVVLVHGWAGNRTYWASQIDLLAERHRVVVLDLGGHGESGLGRDDWNLPAFGDDVVAVVNEVGADDVALFGALHGRRCQSCTRRGRSAIVSEGSFGSTRSAHSVASRHRRRRTSPRSSRRSTRTSRPPLTDSLAACSPEGADASLVDHVAADMAAVRRDAPLGSLGYALNREPPLLAALAELTAPVVAISPDTASTDVESLRRHGVEPIVLTGVGHFPMLEDPDRFNPVLVEALASFER